MKNERGQWAGGSKHLVTHGKAGTRIYNIWNTMRARCGNPNVKAYPDYGGRGINVCVRWLAFENFLADMGEPPDGCSIDRIDNERGYEPGNVRWATRIEQARNKRGLHLLAANGEELPLCVWAERTSIKIGTLWNRVKLGWTSERVVTEPVRKDARWHGARHGVRWTDPTIAQAA